MQWQIILVFPNFIKIHKMYSVINAIDFYHVSYQKIIILKSSQLYATQYQMKKLESSAAVPNKSSYSLKQQTIILNVNTVLNVLQKELLYCTLNGAILERCMTNIFISWTVACSFYKSILYAHDIGGEGYKYVDRQEGKYSPGIMLQVQIIYCLCYQDDLYACINHLHLPA